MTDSLETKPFDRSELEKCFGCGKGVLHGGDLHFYEVTVSQCIADIKSIQQQHGLEVMMGAAGVLAPVFAPSTNVAHRLPGKRRLLCASCGMRQEHNVSIMLEDC